MLTKSNQRIIQSILRPSFRNKDTYLENFDVLTEDKINGLLEHTLLRLYTGFHVKLFKDRSTIQQLSLLAHLGLIDLHESNNTNRINVTLSSFGTKIMNILAKHRKKLIKREFKYKDKLNNISSILTDATFVVTFMLAITNFVVIMIIQHFTIKANIPLLCFVISFIVWLATMIICCSLVAYKAHKIIENNEIKLYDILKACKVIKGQHQAKCEKQCILKYYHNQQRLLKTNYTYAKYLNMPTILKPLAHVRY